MLAVVQATAEQTRKTSMDVDHFMRRLELRLQAMSSVQDLLSRETPDAITLRDLVEMQLDALCPEGARARVTVSGPVVTLHGRLVQTLMLAIHGLSSNALKQGALSDSGNGQLAISWRVEGEQDQRSLHLEWQESGVSPPSGGSNNRRPGYGRALIENALSDWLGAETKFTLIKDRLRCSFDLPLGRPTALDR
jgi:two-component sensor histidine kinase